MNAHRHDSPPFARLVHLLLLLGWLFSSHGIAPAVCMMAAMLDGDHAVRVGVSNEGAMTVVLSHAGKSAAELTAHEHDALCRMLVAFAEAPASNAADHILAFKTVDDTSRTQRLLLSLPVMVKTLAVVHIVTFHPHVIGRQVQRCTWSHALTLKSGRTVMRC